MSCAQGRSHPTVCFFGRWSGVLTAGFSYFFCRYNCSRELSLIRYPAENTGRQQVSHSIQSSKPPEGRTHQAPIGPQRNTAARSRTYTRVIQFSRCSHITGKIQWCLRKNSGRWFCVFVC
jgi:hypothetical protein